MTDRRTPDPRTPGVQTPGPRTPDPQTSGVRTADPRTPDQTPEPDQTGPARWPLWLALTAIGLVWLAGAVWSFEEQTALARSKGFNVPELLPLVIDGMAIAMAAVAFAANLDGRPAVAARIGTALSVACSATSNGTWAWERSAADPVTVALAAAVPVVANLAFEVLLSEVRRQVQRRRGMPAPVPIPFPRLIRWVLAPWDTPRQWRRLVLEATDPRLAFEAVRSARTRRQTARVQTPNQRTPDPAPVQTPNGVQTPSPVQTPNGVQTPDGSATKRTRRTNQSGPTEQSGPARSGLRVVGDDEAIQALRDWMKANGRRPSLDQVQEILGCGRSRAQRIRGLFDADLSDDDKERVRADAHLIGATA